VTIRYRFENSLYENIGEKGLKYEDILAYAEENLERHHKNLIEKRKNGTLGFFDLPYDKELVKKINELKKKYIDMKNIVVIGIGGSSLGNITLNDAINGVYHNERDTGLPKIYFADNVDPEKMAHLLEILDPKETVFNVITKSGSTAETMTNFMVLYDFLEKNAPDKVKENLIITTDKEKGNLVKIAAKLGLDTFVIPHNVGGRFSVLSSVGLVPAALTGVDIEKLLLGAADMDKICSADDIEKNPAYMSALIHYLFYRDKGVNINVLMPYTDNLASLSDWFRQLWAESLGKIDKEGKNVGITPVKSVGAIDQHSQVQLYIEGPFDKLITFIEVEKFRNTVRIPEVFTEIKGLNYLCNQTFDTLINNEKKATELALTEANRPNTSIIVPVIDEYHVGQLFYMMEVMTAFAGELFNIDAFDQPGVEAGKVATYALMGREGYEGKRGEIEKELQNKKEREM